MISTSETEHQLSQTVFWVVKKYELTVHCQPAHDQLGSPLARNLSFPGARHRSGPIESQSSPMLKKSSDIPK